MANDYNVKEAEAQNLHKRITKADDILNSPLIKILTLMGSGGVGAGMLHNYGKEGDLASKFYKSITAYDDTPLSDINISANMLHETSGAYKNPQQLQEQNKTVLHNIISKLPSYEQTGGNTGGLTNALIRKLMTGSYDRKKSPYILDEMPQESIPPKSK